MYDLNQTAHDFPWTAVTYNDVEPWREVGSNWFNELPKGWGDIIHDCLVKVQTILERYNLEDRFVIEQVKEKWGSLRFYYYIKADDDFPLPLDHPAVKDIDEIIARAEDATTKVCCDCGTTADVHCYGGWVHFACTSCEKERQRRLAEMYGKDADEES